MTLGCSLDPTFKKLLATWLLLLWRPVLPWRLVLRLRSLQRFRTSLLHWDKHINAVLHETLGEGSISCCVALQRRSPVVPLFDGLIWDRSDFKIQRALRALQLNVPCSSNSDFFVRCWNTRPCLCLGERAMMQPIRPHQPSLQKLPNMFSILCAGTYTSRVSVVLAHRRYPATFADTCTIAKPSGKSINYFFEDVHNGYFNTTRSELHFFLICGRQTSTTLSPLRSWMRSCAITLTYRAVYEPALLLVRLHGFTCFTSWLPLRSARLRCDGQLRTFSVTACPIDTTYL